MSLAVSGLTKFFGGTRALDEVTLAVDDGRVLALLGHNGAGKSTLIRCLGGAFTPDAGRMRLGTKDFDRLTPRQSRDAGVAIIYQNLNLVDALSVSDNLFLGQEQRRGPIVRRRSQLEAAERALAEVGASCSSRSVVGDLPMGQRQLVAIARAVLAAPQILVLDEPTAALSTREAQSLLDRVQALRAGGLAILYVTHLLGEVERLADDVVVLRNGRVAHNQPRAGMSRGDLVEAISGHAPQAAARSSRFGAPRLTVEGLAGPGFGPVDLQVQAGEVLAVHGLIGSGRTRLLETIAGRRRRTKGVVAVDGRRAVARTPAAALRAGIALVPADRARQGLFLPMRADDNVLISSLGPLSRFGVRRRRAERAAFDEVAASVSLTPPDAARPATAYSGGNQQKLLVSRWMTGTRPVPVLLLDEPTQGVDVGAREEIYRVVRARAADAGCAVLVSTSDPEEVEALADRCLIIASGRVAAELSGPEIGQARLVEISHRSIPLPSPKDRQGS